MDRQSVRKDNNLLLELSKLALLALNIFNLDLPNCSGSIDPRELFSVVKQEVRNGQNLKNEKLAPFHQEPKYHRLTQPGTLGFVKRSIRKD